MKMKQEKKKRGYSTITLWLTFLTIKPMFSHYKLQTPVIMIEWLHATSKNFDDDWETAGYAYALYRILENYRPKQTLKSLLLK